MSFDYSVVIPAYNAAANIHEAVDSVLSQSIPPFEVIVVDDGSTDETAHVVERIEGPVRLIQRPNGGPGAATTQGIEAVTTPWLASLDSDDIWLPTKIERQFDALRRTGPHISFTLARLFKGPTPVMTIPFPAASKNETPFGNAGRDGSIQRLWTRSTMLMETKVACTVGEMIDPPGGRGDMVDWLARCQERGYRLEMVEEVLALRRIRPGSLSYGRDTERDAGYMHVVRRALERKRKSLAEARERMAQ